jgi:hypothetical protein
MTTTADSQPDPQGTCHGTSAAVLPMRAMDVKPARSNVMANCPVATVQEDNVRRPVITRRNDEGGQQTGEHRKTLGTSFLEGRQGIGQIPRMMLHGMKQQR